MASDEKKILLVEDEKAIRDAVAAYLERESYIVRGVGDGQSAVEEFEKHTFDLVILDLMLPKLSGERVCRAVRETSNVPIIMLTAKGEVFDKVLGLELGADDFVTKPFSMRELVARVRAVLRRMDRDQADVALLRAGDVALDRRRRQVTVDQRSVDLTPSEFDLLAVFLTTPGRVFTRAELLDRLQGGAYDGYERTIDVHIRNLRTKIEPDPSKPRYVETVYGVGYRFAAEA